MYVEVYIDEDDLLSELSKESKEELVREAILDLLKELHYIHEARGKEAMLTKLEFLMNDYNLPHLKLTP